MFIFSRDLIHLFYWKLIPSVPLDCLRSFLNQGSVIFFVFISFLPDVSDDFIDKSQDQFCVTQYTLKRFTLALQLIRWLFQNLCIPLASSSFSAFLSDCIYFTERHKPSEMLILSVAHHSSKTFCAYESPSCPSSFHSGAEAVQWITSSAPHRQLHTGFFMSAMKQAQVSPNLFKA